MKFQAIRLYSEGGERKSRLVEQSLSDLDAGEVVIRSRYAAVNYKDARAVTGVGNVISRFPCVPGVEVVGTVVDPGGSGLREGELVTVQGGRDFGMRRDGAYSEYVRVPAEWVGRVPPGSDGFYIVGMGLAAYTSALAVDELLQRGIKPESGPVVVTGGTGGSSSFAIDMLAGLGFHVVASTGKATEHEYLKKLGAAQIIGREQIASGDKPLEDQRWAAAIDAVGGAPLDALLRSMKKRGVVCAFGNAAGEELKTSIYPFILRSVSLVGINGNHPVPERGDVWRRMMPGGDLHPRHIHDICYTIPFSQLLGHCERLIAGGVRGRAIVTFGT
ncbi:acrylyl-CoA reductase family protein [Ramlibacter sp. AN1133]|uniref:acrylyl-CoA reductase family protein n=1 Tax=Ramlibacter sp. AN1133 TaxID=3133429 RepID=UPI0030BD11AF